MGPRSAKTAVVGRGFHLGPKRDWSGLHERRERQFNLNADRVAIQRGWNFGKDAEGRTVPTHFFAPIFVSSRRAEELVAAGLARFCGISGGDGVAL
jgi:hypothetical protein